MTKYICSNCKKEKEISKHSLLFCHDLNEWVVKQSLCSCGKYMDSKPVDGFPSLIRTESSLSKK